MYKFLALSYVAAKVIIAEVMINRKTITKGVFQ